ncbi:EF-hand domain-containing protein 1 [Cephus cinctus]|uniref:EF-hand domain-containing protein 1 n=1 Tax=Cephus cinctus TaxID=211228 RepID=A0AAJ7BJP3_CEPCN|nr:EF-hand domain-containing protein 1 [Cephus cinctus]
MHELPLLPGYSCHDSTVQDYKLKQKFNFLNGFRVLRDSNIGIGRRPIDTASSAYAGDLDSVQYDPSLTYGRVREYAYQQFVPHYAKFAQKCLCFKAFFRQGIFNSPDEHFRIRHVNIIYFLEDDTILVSEPPVDNAGFKQGKLVRRERIVKNIHGDYYHWKDLNVGIDIAIYGVVYHTVDCDLFTREFLCSQGIDVGDKEELPPDPYIQFRAAKSKASSCVTPVADDPRRRFLEYDGMVLSFDAIWNDDFYQVMYFLTDDTVAVREIHRPNDGKDPVAMLLKRTKLPKNWKDVPSSFPGIYMERGDLEVVEYYTPQDFKIGDTIFIFGRRFFLYDCDAFTRKYYSGMLGLVQPPRICPPVKEERSSPKYQPPPHIPFGTPEDTLASCLSFMPKPPKKDVVRQLYNFPKKLRYSMIMEAVHPEDEDRDFILEYNLSDGTILISEIEKRNSGRRAGCFLNSMLVPKPGTDKTNPVYYTPEDFYIGAKINIFNHRFIINGADLFVYRYIEANPEKFPQELRDQIRNYFVAKGLLKDDIAMRARQIRDTEDTKPDLDPNLAEPHKDSLDPGECLADFEKDAQKRYEGEHGELRPPTPPPEELCPGLATVNEPVPLRSYEPQDEPKLQSSHRRKEIKWADQIDKDSKGHPVISCRPEYPECKTIIPRECATPHYFKQRDRRFEVAQLMYENATEPSKPKFPPEVPMYEREPGRNVISMAGSAYKAS